MNLRRPIIRMKNELSKILILLSILALDFVNCSERQEKTIDCPEMKNEAKTPVCAHPMFVTIKPHSEKYNRPTKITFCYYKRKADFVEFFSFRNGKPFKLGTVNVQEIIW